MTDTGSVFWECKSLEVIGGSINHPTIRVLIGRDILNQCKTFTYEGIARVFTLEM
jgi:hypothetical protein